jgi:elongator complex protein 3
MIQAEMNRRDIHCSCIRCREPKQEKANRADAVMNVVTISSHHADELFITFDSTDTKTLYAFCRLRMPTTPNGSVIEAIPELKDAALLRELHTYGVLTPLNDAGEEKAVQHLGFGRKLMAKAEELAIARGCKRLAVIAGVGVRAYYTMLGYRLEGTYMIKDLANT